MSNEVYMPITIKDIGPIHDLKIPIPQNGGIVVLRGKNGTGKSSALEAIEAMANGSKLALSSPIRDGAKNGEVNGFGVKLTVAKSTRHTGELEVSVLESKFLVADLVDPKIDNPESADRKRIKALVGLSSKKADPSMFYGLVGGKSIFSSVVSENSLDAVDDPVLLAAKIKRDFEAGARQEESAMETASAKEIAIRERFTGIDLNGEDNLAKLQQEYGTALVHETEIKNKQQRAAEIMTAAKEANAKIESSERQSGALSLDDAKVRVDQCANDLEQQSALLANLREQVKIAENKWRELDANLKIANAALDTAIATDFNIKNLREIVQKADGIEIPSENDFVAAQKRTADAQRAVSLGIEIRKAKEAAEQADRIRAEYLEHKKKADVLRNGADGTDEVLSSLIKTKKLKVVDGRLMTKTDRGMTFFSDLSNGERWRIAVDIAAESVGENGLIVLPQESWEGLDPDNRKGIAEHAKSLGVTIITAEAANGELKAEILK